MPESRVVKVGPVAESLVDWGDCSICGKDATYGWRLRSGEIAVAYCPDHNIEDEDWEYC